MKKTAKILFCCALLWEAASVLWFLNPFRYDFSAMGWLCVALGVLCAVAGVVENRK